jgi:SAM-dependent methyltransferase
MYLPAADRLQRRGSFDDVAGEYADARPGYPPAVFDTIVTRVPPPARVLEVGPGPGLATLPMAERGYAILGIELGQRLATVARQRLRDFPNVEIIHADFESWEPTGRRFDVVLAASSWHWIEPQLAFDAAHHALSPGGHLALVANHPRPGQRGSAARAFWDATDEIYRRHAPGILAGRSWSPHRLPFNAATIKRSGLFNQVERLTWRWSREFTSEAYLRLLETYSDHRALPDRERRALMAAMRDTIDGRFGGVVQRVYWTHLHLARPARGAGA